MTVMNNEHMDPIVQKWVDQVRAAQADNTPLRLVGSGSKHFYGHPTEGQEMVLTEHQGVIDYEPSELVITVKGGDRKSTRLNSSHVAISYAVFCLIKKTK